nr:chemotaxis protein CheA [uncultured Holophaga sp.]
MSSLVDESIVSDFVTESREHLNNIEPDLLAMEQSGSNAGQEVLNRVFRAIHSIKGGAGFLAFERLKSLSHAMENVLMLIRDGKLEAAPPVMDALLASLDRLRAMLDDIHSSDQIPCDQELARLKGVLEQQGQPPDAKVSLKPEGGSLVDQCFDIDEQALRSCLNRGMQLYHARAFLHRDIKDKGLTPLSFLNNALGVGNCLDAYIDISGVAELGQCLEQDLAVSLLFATVLERDLAVVALKLPEEQVVPLDTKGIKAHLGIGKPMPAAAPVPDPAPEAAPPVAVTAAPAEEPAPPEAAKPTPKDAQGPETLRVRVDLLTALMNQVGELVLGRNQLMRAMTDHQREIPGLSGILQNISQVTSELQERVMQTRMQPIGTVFNRFPRIIRDMSRALGKQIEIQIMGGDVELDKSIVELLADPLTHIIRNSADHAIETPEARVAKGKPASGQIVLHAFHQGGQVNIAISDDGQGIDPRKVLKKALEKGILTQTRAAELTEREVVNLIFAPGFSTAETVSEISGRGVGMDVVRTNTEKLGGRVEVESEPGMGTTVLLRLPLTLAIIPSMIVGVSEQRFAIPQVNIVEFVWIRARDVRNRIERLHGAQVLRLRDKLLPLIRLADVLEIPRSYEDPASGEALPDRRLALADRRSPEGSAGGESRTERRVDARNDYSVVVLRLGPHQFGVIVDELFDIEEIVVKPLSSYIADCKCFSGATILGDGRAIMILDPGGIATTAELHFSDIQEEEKRRKEQELQAAALKASRTRSIILFKVAGEERFAVPQEQVKRLERIEARAIERVGNREYWKYLDEPLPLLRLDSLLPVSPLPPGREELYLIIPKSADGSSGQTGIIISDILDALDVDVDLKPMDLQRPGLLGSAMVHDRLTVFLDPQELVAAGGAA